MKNLSGIFHYLTVWKEEKKLIRLELEKNLNTQRRVEKSQIFKMFIRSDIGVEEDTAVR